MRRPPWEDVDPAEERRLAAETRRRFRAEHLAARARGLRLRHAAKERRIADRPPTPVGDETPTPTKETP